MYLDVIKLLLTESKETIPVPGALFTAITGQVWQPSCSTLGWHPVTKIIIFSGATTNMGNYNAAY